METVSQESTRSDFVSIGGALARDAGPMFLVRLVGAAANFTVLLVLIYRLPEAEVGLYYFLVNLWNILNVLVDFGGDPMATREIARHPEREGPVLRDFLSAKAGLSGIGLLVFALVVLGLVTRPEYRTSCLLTVFVLPGFFLGSFSVVFRVRHRMRWPALALLVGNLVFLVGSLAGLFGLVGDAARFRALTLSYAGGTLAGGFLIWWFARRHVPRLGPGRGALRFLRVSWPQGVAALAGILYFYVDTLMLKALRGDAQAGYYNAAYRLLNFVIYAAGLVSLSVMPVLARDHERNLARLQLVFQKTFTLLIWLAVPVGAVGLALAPELMTFLYRERMATYGVAVPTLRILLVGGLFAFGGALASTTLVAVRRQGQWTWVALTGLGINVGLNLALIPRFGHLGAAWATMITEVVVVVLCLAVLSRFETLRPDARAVGKLVLLGGVVFATGIMVCSLPFVVAVGVCLLVYLAGTTISGVFPRELFRLGLHGADRETGSALEVRGVREESE